MPGELARLTAGDVTYLANDWAGLSQVVVAGASDEDIAALPIAALRRVYGDCFMPHGKPGAVGFNLRVLDIVMSGKIPFFTYTVRKRDGSTHLRACLGSADMGTNCHPTPSRDESLLLLACLRGKVDGTEFDVSRLPEELRCEAPDVFLNLLAGVSGFGSNRPARQSQPVMLNPMCVYRVNNGEALLVTWGQNDHLPGGSPAFLRDRGYDVIGLPELSHTAMEDLTRPLGLLYDMVGWFPELLNPFRRMEEGSVRKECRGDLLVITDLRSNLGRVGRGG